MDAVRAAAPGGRIVLAGLKGGRAVPGLVSDEILEKQLTFFGVLSIGYEAYREALRIIASDRHPLDRLRTHAFRLEDAADAIRTLARVIGDGVDPLGVSIRP